MNYETLKTKYLNKLENIEVVLKELDKFQSVLEIEDINKLKNIQQKNMFYLNKLHRGQIEVALIGAESSGKSLLGNALVKHNIFPSKNQRTTYTPVTLKYGSTNTAKISFFTISEFNEKFRELLGLADINTNDDFRYFHLKSSIIDPNLKKDIEDIVKYKEVISKYLNKEQLKLEISMNNEELNKFITDEGIARAVKYIEIELDVFEETKELVLYDVPGFTSTTKKHKLETIENLNKADAVILVKSLLLPDIQDYEESILKNYDNTSGLSIQDKLFVFGTQIDRLNIVDDVAPTLEKFYKELQTNLSLKSHKIFEGSPYAYLESIKLKDGNEFSNKLKNWNQEKAIYSVDNLRDAIKKFYQNEVFNNIKTQIDKNIKALFDILNKITSFDESDRLRQLNKKERNLFNEFLKSTKIDIIGKLSKLNKNIKEEIEEKSFLSNILKEQIEKEFSIDDTDISEMLETAESLNVINMGYRNTNTPLSVNIKYRENELLPKLKEKFFNLVLEVATDTYMGYKKDIINEVIKTLNVSIDLEEKLIKYIDEKIIPEKFSKTNYLYLIHRFSSDLFDVMIKSPKGSQDRLETIKAVLPDFITLAFYFENLKDVSDFNNSKLIQKILNIQETNKSNLTIEFKNKQQQNKFDLDNIKVAQSSTIDSVLDEMIVDIENLRDILKNGVIPLLKLELPFIISIHNQIEILKTDGFEDFITEYFEELKASELDEIKYQKENIANTMDIVNKVNKLKLEYL